MHTMVIGRAQALGSKNEASAYHQNGRALWRHLSLLLSVLGKHATQKESAFFGIGIGIGIGIGYGGESEGESEGDETCGLEHAQRDSEQYTTASYPPTYLNHTHIHTPTRTHAHFRTHAHTCNRHYRSWL